MVLQAATWCEMYLPRNKPFNDNKQKQNSSAQSVYSCTWLPPPSKKIKLVQNLSLPNKQLSLNCSTI